MPINYGKKFEQKFKIDFLKTIPNSTVDRLYDPVGGFYGIKNICDFICYSFPNIFYIELKSHKGASVPFDNISQYEKLKQKIGIPGVRCGVIVWLYDKDVVLYVPCSTIQKMKKDGKKSVGLKSINEGYRIIKIPSTKKKLYMESNYGCLLELKDGE